MLFTHFAKIHLNLKKNASIIFYGNYELVDFDHFGASSIISHAYFYLTFIYIIIK